MLGRHYDCARLKCVSVSVKLSCDGETKLLYMPSAQTFFLISRYFKKRISVQLTLLSFSKSLKIIEYILFNLLILSFTKYFD